jgi:hypothetical protein
MGIRNLPTLDHMANNCQERCYLAFSYLAVQIGHIASTIVFLCGFRRASVLRQWP